MYICQSYNQIISNNMKHLIVLVFSLLFCFGSNLYAQVPSMNNVDIKYRGFGNYSDENGNKLSKTDLKQVLTAYEYSDYLAAKRKKTTGIVLTSVGVAAEAFSAYTITTQSNETAEEFTTAIMYPVIVGGVICMAIGIPKLFVAGHKFRSVAKEHNSNNNDVSLSFGPTQNGVGFALTF